MKLVIQRVKSARVEVEGTVSGSIQQGYMILVGIEEGDAEKDVVKAADKVSGLRVFDDTEGKMNLDISSVNGSILSVSQFTLSADVRKGNRPSFITAMGAQDADALYQRFNDELRAKGLVVETGVFQTHMNVFIDNDGPVTIIMTLKDGKVL